MVNFHSFCNFIATLAGFKVDTFCNTAVLLYLQDMLVAICHPSLQNVTKTS